MTVEIPVEVPDSAANFILPGINVRKIHAGEVMTPEEETAILLEPNSLAHLAPAEPVILPVKPIDYRGNVNSSGSPINVEIDRLGTAILYQQELGFTPAEIADVEIYVIGEGNMTEIEPDRKKRKELFPYGSPKKGRLQKYLGEEDTYAVSDVIKDKDDEGKQRERALVVIYLSVLWSDFKRDKSTILSYSKKRQKELTQPSSMPSAALSDNDAKFLEVSKRLLKYLEIAPLERISGFLDRLAEIKARREILGDIVHEGAHLEESRHKKIHPLLENKWFLSALYFLARFNKRAYNYLEKKAEEEEERVTNKSIYFEIVDFKINKPQSETPKVSKPLAA